jgi:BirA family biotin operon repressor/biotin-[acetyl-CoA-carboxylase] ligase
MSDLPVTMTTDQLLRGWTPARVGRHIEILPETNSTNTRALASADDPESDGLTVFADHQTAGRGRLGRSWSSPRGASILCTVLLIHPVDRREHEAAVAATAGGLTLASAVGACEAIRHVTNVTPTIKWPNDIQMGGRKLGGILIESRRRGDGAIAWAVGIGINCLQQSGHFPTELKGTATSLEIESHHPIDRAAVARGLLKSWDRWLALALDGKTQVVHAAWMTYAEPIGRRVTLRYRSQEYTGHTVAIDPAGGLIVQGEDGSRHWFDPMQTTLL